MWFWNEPKIKIIISAPTHNPRIWFLICWKTFSMCFTIRYSLYQKLRAWMLCRRRYNYFNFWFVPKLRQTKLFIVCISNIRGICRQWVPKNCYKVQWNWNSRANFDPWFTHFIRPPAGGAKACSCVGPRYERRFERSRLFSACHQWFSTEKNNTMCLGNTI